MSNVCDNCGKGKLKGHLVSHSNRKTNRAYKPNLQTVVVDNVTKKFCTRCIKRMNFKKGN